MANNILKNQKGHKDIGRQDHAGLGHFHCKKVSDLTQSYLEQGELSGTVTLVSYRGKIIHFEGKGKMSLETGQPMRKDAIFRLYSMTKPITSVAAMMLAERGAFSLDTPVSEFLPEFKDTEVFLSGTASAYKTIKPDREINMGDLLSHTSGLTYNFKQATVVDEIYRNAQISSFNPACPLDRFTKKIAGTPLQFSPGKRWNYSLSTDILGHVIEVISGQTLGEFLKQEVFGPLGMVDTGFYVPEDKQDRFAANYMRNMTGLAKKLIVCDAPKTGWYSKPPIACSGGAGLVSTAGDYLKFASMLLNKGFFNKVQLLKPSTVRLMTKNHIPGDGPDFIEADNGEYILPGQGFGLGFGITLDPMLEQIPGNSGTFGWAGAAHTLFFVDPREHLIAIFLTQLLPYNYKLEMMQQFKRAVYESIHEGSSTRFPADGAIFPTRLRQEDNTPVVFKKSLLKQTSPL